MATKHAASGGKTPFDTHLDRGFVAQQKKRMLRIEKLKKHGGKGTSPVKFDPGILRTYKPYSILVRSTLRNANLLGLDSWYLQNSGDVSCDYALELQFPHASFWGCCFLEVLFSESFILQHKVCSVITQVWNKCCCRK